MGAVTPMKPTSPVSLILVALVCALGSNMIVARFFGSLVSRGYWELFFPWVLIAVCLYGARRVRAAIDDNGVGQDRSQMNPLTLARWLVVGTASAWLGAVLTGVHAGGLFCALPRWADLAAAQEDGPVAAVGAITGLALAIAGLWLERSCRIPPDDEGSAPSGGEPLPPSVGWNA